ncbi:MAG: glycosyltransferase family 4 protein [Psychroserpens sp.]|uniref:glycosyltransferase family 4 protein n=1 Tax=Psychroserpens sp. TaxID=2020870 RepID=UPI0030022F18
MKPKKIAIVVEIFPTISQTFIVNQVNSLIDAGFQVELFSYNKTKESVFHPNLDKHDLLEKVTYLRVFPFPKVKRVVTFLAWVFSHYNRINWNSFFDAINGFKYGEVAYTLKMFFEAQWFLLGDEFDVIHAHFGHNAKRIAFLKETGLLSKSKLITTFHGYDLVPNHVDFYQKEYHDLLKYSDAFTVNSIYLKGLLEELKPDKPVHILPVGLDTSYFERTEPKSESNYFDILFCGRFIALKGPDVAIKIIKELHNRGYDEVRLHLIGDGELKHHLQELISDFNFNNVIKMYGVLTQDIVKEKMQNSDIFLLPGIYDPNNGTAETQGLVIQEAQAMGLPVVVSDVGGMKYGLIDGETGFVLEANNISAFADSIERLILDDDLKTKMSANAVKYVQKHFDTGVLVRELENIYKGAM